MIYVFGDCELDEEKCELRRGGEPYHVEPQVFDVLAHLARNPDRVVSRDELLDEIWGHRFVTPASVSARIKSARRAVGDDGTAQKVIRTVRGRGFRLAMPVEVRGAQSAAGRRPDTPSRLPEPPPPGELPVSEIDRAVVARRAELDRLRTSLGTVLSGARRLVLVCGESGIGKSTLVGSFADAAEAEGYLLGRGHSIEQGGAGEPYLPVLDALGRMSHGPHGEDVVEVLREYAPTWLTQMPSLRGPGSAAETGSSAAPATRERMLREMVEALEALARQVPLILFLEDLHWADRSTLDLLHWLALRPEPARLLVLGTYRSGEMGAELRALVTKLRRLQTAEEIPLPPWSVEAVASYLEERLGESSFPPELPRLVLDRSAGNPLFAKSLFDQWIARGDLERNEDGWRLVSELATLGSDLPQSLQDAIELQVDALGPADQEVLEAASVQGTEFLATVVAAAVDRPDEEVERRCTELSRKGPLIGRAGSRELPDRTATACFAFSHDLYREALYDRIPPQRRIRMHARVAGRLEETLGADAPEHASELALHNLRGKSTGPAIEWLKTAARRALSQSAHHEAVTHLQVALGLVTDTKPDDALELELELQQMLAPARLEIGGWDDPGAEHAYARAKEIAALLEDPEGVGQALYGLAYLHEVRGEYPVAQAILAERLALSESRPDAWSTLEGYDMLGCSLFHEGHFRDAMTNAELAVEWAVKSGRQDNERVSLHHPGVSSRYWAATLHWFLGRPEKALAMAAEAVEVAGRLGHVPTLVFAEARRARIHQFLQQPTECSLHAERAVQLADKHGLPYQRSVALTLAGWAEAHLDDPGRGIARIREGLAYQEEAGTVMDYPYAVGLLADALLATGEPAEALAAAESGSVVIERLGGDFFWSAELERLRGLALRELSSLPRAEDSLRRAADVARRQGSTSLELRSLVDLAETKNVPAQDRILTRVEELLASITEGQETADPARARALLERARRAPHRQ
ncbi:MAG: AAA family ATPase [Gemmatimonadota bacterium]|jgi:DNA-binding winged helix-turn-helix (wHTH) protein/tetratricopeptide (TPR) repeat protein